MSRPKGGATEAQRRHLACCSERSRWKQTRRVPVALRSRASTRRALLPV